jgi:hypothetical protein
MIARPDLAAAFAGWVLSERRDDLVPVPPHRDADGVHVDALPAATVAYQLADHSRTLPESVAIALRLPVSATFAHAARLLWCLRDDETQGCRTYDEAVRTLQSLPPVEFRRYYDVVDEAVDAVTTTLPVWPGADTAA